MPTKILDQFTDLPISASAKWQLRNPEKAKAYHRNWWLKNRERALEIQKRWRESNPEKYAAIQKAWLDAHPGYAAANAKKRRSNPDVYNADLHKNNERSKGKRVVKKRDWRNSVMKRDKLVAEAHRHHAKGRDIGKICVWMNLPESKVRELLA